MSKHEETLREMIDENGSYKWDLGKEERGAIAWALEQIERPKESTRLAMDVWHGSPRPWRAKDSYHIVDANGRYVTDDNDDDGDDGGFMTEKDRDCAMHCTNVLPELVEAAEKYLECKEPRTEWVRRLFDAIALAKRETAVTTDKEA